MIYQHSGLTADDLRCRRGVIPHLVRVKLGDDRNRYLPHTPKAEGSPLFLTAPFRNHNSGLCFTTHISQTCSWASEIRLVLPSLPDSSWPLRARTVEGEPFLGKLSSSVPGWSPKVPQYPSCHPVTLHTDLGQGARAGRGGARHMGLNYHK